MKRKKGYVSIQSLTRLRKKKQLFIVLTFNIFLSDEIKHFNMIDAELFFS